MIIQRQDRLRRHANARGSLRPSRFATSSSRGQSAVTLLEVLVVVAVSGLIVSAVSAWMISTFSAQAATRQASETAKILSTVNTKVVRDVASAQFAAANRSGDADQVLVDCGGNPTGEATSPDDIKLVLVTPGDRRIVYTLVEAPSGEGKALYRRDCPNTLTGPNDPTLNDPNPSYLNEPVGDDATAATRSTLLAEGISRLDISDVESSCPPNPSEPNTVSDVNCRTVRLVVHLENYPQPVIFESTRRTDTYCAPGCAPVASFTVADTVTPSRYDPDNPESVLTFDATSSYDRRGSYRGPESDPTTRLHYHWQFDVPHTVNGVDGVRCRPAALSNNPDPNAPTADPVNPNWSEDPTSAYPQPANQGDPPIPYEDTQSIPNDDPIALRGFATGGDCTNYTVTLTVTNAEGRSSTASKTIRVQGDRPIAQIDPLNATYRIVKNKSIQFTSTVQTFDGNLDGSRSYWDFGDGSARVPLVPASSTPSHGDLVCGSVAPDCTADPDYVSHSFSAQGTYVVRLVVQDSKGQWSQGILLVTVEPEMYFVSTSGQNTTTCGGQDQPCQTIAKGIDRAREDGKTDVYVDKGTYDGFQALEGINVSGGRDRANNWVYSPTAETKIAHEPSGPQASERHGISISGSDLPTMLSNLSIVPNEGVAEGSAQTLQLRGVVIDGSTNVVLRNLDVRPGTGVNPTGVLVTGGSQVSIESSQVRSGTPAVPPDLIGGFPDPGNRSAYGVRVLGGSTVVVRGGNVTAAPGVTGAKGIDGAADGSRACLGAPGRWAFVTVEVVQNDPACTTATANPVGAGTGGNRGGGGGENEFGGAIGERGAPGTPSDGGPSGGAPGSGSWIGKAGSGGPGGGGVARGGAGSGGAAGSNGVSGAGDLFIGTSGTSGTAADQSTVGFGTAGAGGGGGGGSTAVVGGASEGASGGGGGGGGRPATDPGLGGSSGGGSFGVYSSASSVTVSDGARVTAGKAGDGGIGGIGGKGGAGGNGGSGTAQSNNGGDSSGGGGGAGGAGAGGGGGGASGPSVAIFSVGAPPSVSGATLAFDTSAAPGAGGAGGAGGDGGVGGAAGNSVGGIFAADPPSMKGVDGSVGTSGQAGARGEAGLSCKIFSTDAYSSPGAPGAECFSSSVASIDRVRVASDGSLAPTLARTNAPGLNRSLYWLVTFDPGPVTGVTASNFDTLRSAVNVDGTMVVTPQNPDCDPLTGVCYATQYLVQVNGVTATGPSDGTIVLRVVNVAGIRDGANTQITNPRPMPFPGQEYIVDQNAPVVTAINRVLDESTNQPTVFWDVTFSERVTAPQIGNFTFSGTVVNPSVSLITKLSDTVYRVTASSGSGDGTLALNLTENLQLVTDDAGNGLGGPFNGQPYTIDKTAPTISSVVRKSPAGERTNATQVTWTVNFSEPVLRVDLTDFALGSSVAGASITSVNAATDGRSADVVVATGTGEGVITVVPVATTDIGDSAGNALDQTLPATYETYEIDRTSPVVVEIVRSSPADEYTNVGDHVEWTARFDEPVNGVTAGRFALDGSLVTGPNPTLSLVSSSPDRKEYVLRATFSGSTNTGSGVVQLKLTETGAGAISDDATNAMAGTEVPGETFRIDRKAPTPGVTKAPASEWTNTSVVLDFSQPPPNGPVDQPENGVVSGIGDTFYTTNGSDPQADGILATDRIATISTAGQTTVKYRTKDVAGNWSAESSVDVNIDQLQPNATQLTISGGTGSDAITNAYIGFARLQFTASDADGPPTQSGIATTWYTLDGTEPTDPLNSHRAAYDGEHPPVIRDEGYTTVRFSSVDKAGNVEPAQQVIFNVETRGPINPAFVVDTCTSPTLGQVASGTGQVQTYVNAGCIAFTAPGVAALDSVLLPVNRVEYYRCAWVDGSPCTASNGTLIGVSSNGDDAYRIETRRLSAYPLLEGVERGYTITAVAYDDFDAMSTSPKQFIGLDMTGPVVTRPKVDGKP